MNGLFELGDFVSSSGEILPFKIECDALTDSDLYCIAAIIANKVKFGKVYGVPTGGDRLARALSDFRTTSKNVLLVDDVLTTGASMEEYKSRLTGNVIGWVVFARGELPDWISAVFKYGK